MSLLLWHLTRRFMPTGRTSRHPIVTQRTDTCVCLATSAAVCLRPPERDLARRHGPVTTCSGILSAVPLRPVYFAIVIGIPTFSILPMVVWNKMLSMRKVVRSHTVSFTE
jgi:hypothetical protein